MQRLDEVLKQLKLLLAPKAQQVKLKGGGSKSSGWSPIEKSEPGKSKSSSSPKDLLPMPGLDALGASKSQWRKEKWFSAGGVVLAGKDDYSKIYIRLPSNNYGPWSFPKGKVDKGETPPKAALREVYEEIGVKAEMVPGGYLGTGEGDYSVTHYYLMYAVRDTGRTDHETEKVALVPWNEAIQTFARAGNLRDLRITTRAFDFVEELRKKGKVP